MKTRKLRDIEVSAIGMGCMGFSTAYGRWKTSAAWSGAAMCTAEDSRMPAATMQSWQGCYYFIRVGH